MLAAANVGIMQVLWGPHWFLPTQWLARHYPHTRRAMAEIEARAVEAAMRA